MAIVQRNSVHMHNLHVHNVYTCTHISLPAGRIRVGRVSLYRYVLGELSRGYLVEKDEAMFSEKQRRVLTFMKTPRELEKVHHDMYMYM